MEEFTRKVALPEGLVLTDTELEYFEGRQVGRRAWICRRVELNALSAPALVAYIEEKLLRSGVRGKVIPPDDVLPRLAREAYRQQMTAWVGRTLDALLSLDAITNVLVEAFAPRMPFGDARRWIEDGLAENATLSWCAALEAKLRTLVWELSTEAEVALRSRVVDAVARQR
jgi:hypothetical protein